MPSTAPIAAIAISKKRKKIFNAFRLVSATTPERAQRLEKLGLSNSLLFRIQVRRKVIVRLPEDKYYLDEGRLIEVNRQRRITVLVTVLICIALIRILYHAL